MTKMRCNGNFVDLVNALFASILLLAFENVGASAAKSERYGVDLLKGGGISVYGSSGLNVIPTAQIIQYGVILGKIDNYIRPGSPSDSVAENYYIGAGVLPGLEVQVGLNELHAMEYNPHVRNDFYNRDLVGNVKYVHNLDNDLSIGIGGQDILGVVVKNQRFYVVLTKSYKLGTLSVGYSKKGTVFQRNQFKNLEGLFAGSEIYLPYNVSALVDYDGFETRGGLRGRIHNLWGSHLQLNIDAQVFSTQADEKISFGVTVSYPLGGDPKAKLEALSDNQLQISSRSGSSNLPDFQSKSHLRSYPTTQSDSDLRAPEAIDDISAKMISFDNEQGARLLADLKADLVESGLEHIALAVDQESKTLYCRYQNRLYDLNELDGLAQAIAVLAPFAKQYDLINIEIELLKQQLPVLSVKFGTAWALGEIQKHTSKAKFYVPKFNTLSDANGRNWSKGQTFGRSEWLSIKLEPFIVSTVGSEVGMYEQSLGVLSELSVPLWRGANAYLTRTDPIHNTYHFKAGRVWGEQRVQAQWKELSISQTWVPFEGFVSLFSYQVALNSGEKTDHLVNNSRYYFVDGRHQVYGEWARHTSNEPQNATGLNVWNSDRYGYEYYWPEKGVGGYIERGVYLNQDLSTKLGFKSYIGDSQLEAALTRSDRGYEKVRLSLTVPFTSKRAWHLGGVTVRGENKWTYGVDTMTDNPFGLKGNLNLGDVRYINIGKTVNQPISLDQHFMDSGRLNTAYMRTHIHQLNQRVKRILYQQ